MTGELPRYFGSVDYWLRRAAGMPVATDALFDKRRKEIHRYTIADVNGPLTLTLPIVKPHGIPRATWRDVKISDHGQWWHIHKVSLESAYGRTPFFEFYIDKFLPFISRETVDDYPSVIHLNEAIDKVIGEVLLLDRLDSLERNDFIESVEAVAPAGGYTPYWQPRRERFGFLAGLSILDLIFCLGPEAPLWIRDNLHTVSNPLTQTSGLSTSVSPITITPCSR